MIDIVSSPRTPQKKTNRKIYSSFFCSFFSLSNIFMCGFFSHVFFPFCLNNNNGKCLLWYLKCVYCHCYCVFTRVFDWQEKLAEVMFFIRIHILSNFLFCNFKEKKMKSKLYSYILILIFLMLWTFLLYMSYH